MQLYQPCLRAEGYRVITAATGREGLQHITSDHPDLILLDLGLPDMDGLKLIEVYVPGAQLPLSLFPPAPWKPAR